VRLVYPHIYAVIWFPWQLEKDRADILSDFTADMKRDATQRFDINPRIQTYRLSDEL